ncbi:hypothetical protein [Exiguobacterium artemiae]|uniref:hypothetical protein n=1 Tax=Exiguobacterium artemiae TaxID=340145 RepID=UPI003CFF0A07
MNSKKSIFLRKIFSNVIFISFLHTLLTLSAFGWIYYLIKKENVINEFKEITNVFYDEKISFINSIDLVSNVVSILSLIYIFLLINNLASSLGNTALDTGYINRLIERNKGRFKNIGQEKLFFLDMITTVFIFISIIVESENIFLKLCIFYNGILLLKYGSSLILKLLIKIKKMNYVQNRYILLKEKNSKESSKYLIVLCIAVTFCLLEKSFEYFFVYSTVFYFISKLIVLLLTEIIRVAKTDYNFAKEEKQSVINQYVITLLMKNYYKSNKKGVFSVLNETLSYKNYSLNNHNEFILLLNDSRYSDETRNLLLGIYESEPVSRSKTSKKLADIIKFRNQKNLLVSILFVFLVVIVFYLYDSKNNLVLLWTTFFWMFFYRFISRSIEIAIAFFKDIRPESKLKRSQLDNNERIVLVVKSLSEIILLSTTLYMVILILMDVSKFNIFNLFFKSFGHALATAIFNTSFPYDVLNSIKIENADYSFDFVVSKIWVVMTQIIHLIQLIMSVVLVSLSITSYGSKSSIEPFYDINLENEKYILIEKIGREENVLYEEFTIQNLYKRIELEFAFSNLNFSQFTLMNDTIAQVLLKKTNTFK